MLMTQYTLAGTLFTTGGLIFQIPSNLLITRIPPRFWLPGCEFVWGLCTLLQVSALKEATPGSTTDAVLVQYRITNVKQLWALRFIIGALEGSCFVGMHWIFGSWYTKKEIGKRAALFAMCAYAGSMFSGYIQSGAQAGLNGVHGLAGWRWLFIIDSVLTFFVAIFGVLMFPGTPDKCTAWYLTEDDKKRCVERLRQDGKGEETDIINFKLFKRVFMSWQLWVLVPVWCCWYNTLGHYIGTVFPLWLKENTVRTFSVYQINNLPTIVPGVNIAMILLSAWAIDYYGRRLTIIWICLIIQTIGNIIICVYDVSFAASITGYVMGGLDGPTSPILLTWCNILCYGDTQQRALTLAIMNTVATMTATVLNQFVYNASTAPRFKQGVILSTVAVLLEWIGVTGIRYIELRTEPARQAAIDAALVESGFIVRSDSYDDQKDVTTAQVVGLDSEKTPAGPAQNVTVM
ncbi:MFS general substrate transporter [Pseudohyphozyma bogoriensis]|nr:MFS general substrate transporter [Pseudohyphozyma bogoriensis]